MEKGNSIRDNPIVHLSFNLDPCWNRSRDNPHHRRLQSQFNTGSQGFNQLDGSDNWSCGSVSLGYYWHRIFCGFLPPFTLADVLVSFLPRVFFLPLQFGRLLFLRMLGIVSLLLVLSVDSQLLQVRHLVLPSVQIYSFFMNVDGGWVCTWAFPVLEAPSVVFSLGSSFVSAGDGITGYSPIWRVNSRLEQLLRVSIYSQSSSSSRRRDTFATIKFKLMTRKRVRQRKSRSSYSRNRSLNNSILGPVLIVTQISFNFSSVHGR